MRRFAARALIGVERRIARRKGSSSLSSELRGSKICVVSKVMRSEVCLDRLSDGELLRRTGELAARGRRLEAALIAHMAEVDRRKLYRDEACSSMFAYATERLRLSEGRPMTGSRWR